jgi:hypothetical protein
LLQIRASDYAIVLVGQHDALPSQHHMSRSPVESLPHAGRLLDASFTQRALPEQVTVDRFCLCLPFARISGSCNTGDAVPVRRKHVLAHGCAFVSFRDGACQNAGWC